MKKSKSFKGIFLVALLFSVFSFQVVSANGTWSTARTFSLVSLGGWQQETTESVAMTSYKSTNSGNWDLHTISKTMWTNPLARMVNSAGDARSSTVITAPAGRTVVGSNNTGSPGYIYYGQARAAAGQIGRDTIRLQMRAR